MQRQRSPCALTHHTLAHKAARVLPQVKAPGPAPTRALAPARGHEVTRVVAEPGRRCRLARKDDVPTEIPDWCICKLTMEPFRDPVQTPAGFTYERSALWEHFKKVSARPQKNGVDIGN